jgi:uncharacterized membrane protein YeaQ/YmgE (transglycosylase-associated protein family)
MIGAIILGLVAGAIARLLIPGDALSKMSGPVSWLLTLVLGLAGSMVGYWIFTSLLGIGDENKFDLGGIVGAILGAVILLGAITFVLNKTGRGSSTTSTV